MDSDEDRRTLEGDSGKEAGAEMLKHPNREAHEYPCCRWYYLRWKKILVGRFQVG